MSDDPKQMTRLARLAMRTRFEVVIAEEPDDSRDKLWFFNLGGYDPREFTELHRNMFLVGPDWRSAKVRAIETVRGWTSPHKDYAFDIETIIDVANAAGTDAISLTRSEEPKPFEFEARYVPIGKMK